MDSEIKVTRAELAQLLGLSAPRVNQLVADGVIEAKGRQFDAIASMRAYISYLKRDEEGRQARIRHQNLKAAQVESRTLRELRRLLTEEEVLRIIGILSDTLFNLRQVESARLFSELSVDLGEVRARSAAYKAYSSLNNLTMTWRDSATSLLQDELRHAGDPKRLDKLCEELAEAVDKAGRTPVRSGCEDAS